MDENCELIENLLKSSGLSCDDLLSKLQEYKLIKSQPNLNEEISTSELNHNGSSQDEQQYISNNNSVILETKSSTVDVNKVDVSETETQAERIDNEDVCTVTALDNSKDSSEIVQNLEITVDCQQSENRSANYEVEKSVTTEEKPLEETSCENIGNENYETPSNEQQLTKISDHDYINPVTDKGMEETSNSSVNEPQSTDIDFEGEMSPSNTGDLPQSEDSLRNIIRMQLSSLRNMKKSNGCLPDLKKKSMFFHNLKKKRRSCEVNPTTSTSGSDDKKEENEVATSNDDSLVSLSDETQIMIVNVSGGVDFFSEEEDPKKGEERRFAAITDTSKEDKSNLESLNNKSEKASPRKDINNILTNYRRKMSLNYFDANSYKFSTPRKDERPPHIMVKKNISQNFNKDPGINKSIKNNAKSPFVSDSLEDFLNESSQLKISYPIPKLGAEEGICEITKQSPYDNVENSVPRVETTSEQDTTQKEKPKLVKAKTLADMRRQFEKLKAPTKSTESQDKKINGVEEKEVGRKLKGSDSQNTNDEITVPKPRSRKISKPPPHRNCFVMYDNTKLLMTGKNKDQCVAIIHSKVDKQTFNEKIPLPKPPKTTLSGCRRPSLLSSLTQSKSFSRVKYKPGPLSKKIELQNIESRDIWKTELKTLPKICLEVMPQVNKPIDPKLVHLLPMFEDPIMTEERVEFALSALKPQKEVEVVEPKIFTFHIPYNNNQEKMVIRKRCTPSVPKEVLKTESSNTASDVAKILSDIITYVEIKEIENTIIKEDDTVQKVPEDKETESNVKTKVRKVKKKKLALELARLNCKVIDVATTEIENKNCSKPCCRLGCVCKSLLCEGVFSNHCQLVKCMFGCKCPPVTSIEMAANNSLSAHTVSHLEDKAKKNLAKEEREFTQTLIHTDNDVILVGTGKVRRSSKPPKKFTDYIADDAIFVDSKDTIPEKKNLKLKNCTVALEKLELFDIQPYCLSHHFYNCPCNGKTIDLPPPKKSKLDQIPKIRIVKTKEDQHKAWYDSCARIRTVFPEYKERNKNPLYNEKLRKTNGYRRKNTKNKAEKQQAEEEYTNVIIHELIIPTDESSTEPRPVKKATKRKQSFNVRQENLVNFSPDYPQEDFNSREFAIQRRRKKIKPNVVTNQSSIFDGEIKVSLKENKEMLNIIGPENASLEYLRILPWSKLIECYQSRKISIWSKNKRSSPILCNAAGYFPPQDYIDIRHVLERSSIIDWILTDTLPPDSPRELMHIILTPKKNHFLISGYCLKKIETNEPQLDVCNDTEGREDTHTAPASCISIGSPSGFEEISITRSEVVENKSTSISLLKPNEIKFGDKPISIKAETLLLKKLPLILPEPVESSQFSEQTVPNDTSPKILKAIKLPSATQITPVPQKNMKSKKFEVVSTRHSLSSDSNIDIFSNGKKSIKLGTLCKQTRPRIHLPGRIIEKSIENTIISSLLNSPVPERNTKDADSSSQATDPLALEENNINNTKSVESEVNNLQEDTDGLTHVNVEVVCIETPAKGGKLLTSKSTTNTSEKTRKADSVVVSKITTTEEKQAPTSKKSISQKSPNSFEQNLTSNRSMKCTHKDMHNENKTLILTSKEFPKRKLYFSKDKKRAEIVLPLPKVSKDSRWRLVYLQSDFTFLTFVNANYSVKYTDLMDVVKMSNNIRKTITLRNKEFSDKFKDPMFGIFCVPDHQDRLFIGPYVPKEKHNIERLRYLQGRLIDTHMFNNMLGINNNEKGPVWVFETPIRPVSLPNGIIIDITEDEHREITVVDLDSDSSEDAQLNVNSQPLTNYLLSPPFVEELTAEELKSKQNFNRYIITNIPHLGYFGACQRDNKAIEVFWPDGNLGYRFPNVTFAKHVLIQYLSQIFCPIPPDFKINVVIMTHLDLQTNKPVDKKYFSKPGPYLCGDFGIYEINEIPDDLLKKNNIPSVEFLLKIHQEAEEREDAIIKIFGLFLMSNEELTQHSESEKILQWATSEVYILEKLAENYQSEKADLENIIRMNSQKLKERRKEERTGGAKDKTNNNNSAPKVSETIEITDSDEDDNQASSADDTNCAFKEITTNGKIENNSFYPKNGNRSLLKPNTWTQRRSLLKN